MQVDQKLWTRESLEKLKGWEQPTVRVRLDGERCNRAGRIVPDAPLVWVEIFYDGEWHAETFGWDEVLAALNDKHSPSLRFSRIEEERTAGR